MAVIQFGESEYLQTTIVENGVYPTEISNIEGPKGSKSGKSVNYYVEFTIKDGKYKGKTHTIVFNSEVNGISLLGEQQFYPVSYFLVLFKVTGLDDGKPKQTALDTDDLLHTEMDTTWAVQTVDGHLINVINEFHPMGYGAQAPAF